MTFVPRNPHTETIELARAVLEHAEARARAIEEENERLGRRNVQGFDGQASLAKRVSGYSGEAAVAVHLGLDPFRQGDHWQSRPDVGGYDVMATKRPDGRLIFTPRHPLWSVKILVVDQSPTFHICGCYPCDDARGHSEWFHVPRPGGDCWMVPQEFLLPIKSRDDLQPIGERKRRALTQFSGDWRRRLTEAGIRPPEHAPHAGPNDT